MQIHKDLVTGDIKLPTLPEVSLRIRKQAADPEVDLNKLTKVAETDPAFCGYLLQIANSPVYRGAVDIHKINLAIGRLGLQNTCNIAMTYAMRSLFNSNKKTIAKSLQQAWQNSTYTASVACIIAENMQHSFDPDEAMLAGLLQDIGCLPLIEKAGNYPELIVDDRAMLFLFDRYAATVGTAILRKWGLHEKFVNVVKNRDNWKCNEVADVNLTDLVLVAKLHTYLGQTLLKPAPRINLIPAFVKLQIGAKLSPKQSLQFVADAKQRISETQRIMGG